jgi:hypothetical protein
MPVYLETLLISLGAILWLSRYHTRIDPSRRITLVAATLAKCVVDNRQNATENHYDNANRIDHSKYISGILHLIHPFPQFAERIVF